jgi:3-hydroxybutyryl-CoA dehydrogenase
MTSADRPEVTVVGAGLMGSGIAQVLATAGCRVTLHDVRESQLTAARHEVEHGRYGLRAAVARGLLDSAEAEQALDRLAVTTDLAAACGSVDLVVEAVPEDLGLKVRVFKELDRVAPPAAILTSNSGGLPIVALAEATSRPERVMGWHWAQPPPVMKLAELVVHASVSDETIHTVSALARACGKNPIVVRDQPMAWGYVANRVHAAARREAALVVEEGLASPQDVDALVKDCFRWPLGPFEMLSMAAEQQQQSRH